MAEVAVAVLGVLPIILEALKCYEIVEQSCKRLKRCKNGIEELRCCLQTYRVIFTNETRRLLSSVLESRTAKDMIADLTSSCWMDTTINAQIELCLNESNQTIRSLGREIVALIKSLEQKFDKIRVNDSEPSSLDKERKKELRKQFKHVFSKSYILDSIESITNLTKKYRNVLSQLQNLAVSKPEPESYSESASPALERLTATQAAARRIYEVLAESCKQHTKHHAQFGLQAQYSYSPIGTEVKFQIAYRHLSRQQAPKSKDVIWFMVESILHGTIASIPPSLSLPSNSPATEERALKRPNSPTKISVQGTIQTSRKRVRFRSPSPTPAETSTQTSVGTDTCHSLRDFRTTADFCTQLSACCKPSHPKGTCIGWLENSPKWKCRVYPSQGPIDQTLPDGPENLSNLLATATSSKVATTPYSKQVYKGVPMLQRLRLGKLLSNAVLNYHATPWMQTCWKSRDIFLYDYSVSHDRAMTKELDAFVEVPVDLQHPSHTPDDLAPFVRNTTLFNLAVILIELAYEKPLQDMIEPTDRKAGMPAITQEYYAAVRLSKEVSGYLGPKYGQIVERCLSCSFGQGTELTNPALQGAVQRDVVLELDRLASGLQDLVLSEPYEGRGRRVIV